MKAILIVDEMPNSCDKCEVKCDGYTAKEYSEKGIKRPSWCPLRPLPSFKAVDLNDTRDVVMLCHGWNACLEGIEK